MSISDLFILFINILFVFLSFIPAFYIPGRVILGKNIVLKGLSLQIVSIIIGISFWAWQGFVFGTLNIRWFTYLYLGFCLLIYIKNKYINEIRLDFSYKKIDAITVLIIILGIFAQTFPYFFMGITTTEGLRFNALNNVDHIWHASLVRELVTRFPPNEPAISNIELKDYHYWYNLVAAELVRIFRLPFFQTQFIGLYSLSSFLLAGIGYLIAKEIYNKRLFINLSLFFLFFIGDISHLITYILQRKFIFTILSLANDATRFNDSPAFAFSIIIGLAALYLIILYKDKLNLKLTIIISLMFISLLEFKVYTGITFITGLASLCAYYMIKKKFLYGLLFIIASLFGGLIFFSSTSSSAGIFLLPFELPRSFIAQKEFGLFDWELRWHIFYDHNNYIRLLQYGIYMSLIYLLTQLGVLFIGLIPIKKSLFLLKAEITIFLYSVVGTGIILALFFYQKVGGANIWEFLLPVIIVLCFLAALNLTILIENKNKFLTLICISLVLILVLPRWIYTVKVNTKNELFTDFHGVRTNELESYSYIKNNVLDEDVILVMSDTEYLSYSSKTKMITGKQFYLSGKGVRQKATTEINRRLNIINSITSGMLNEVIDELRNDKVRYLYYYGCAPLNILENRNLKVVFRNTDATILKII